MSDNAVIGAGAGAQMEIGAHIDHLAGLFRLVLKRPALIPDGNGAASVVVFRHIYGYGLRSISRFLAVGILRLRVFVIAASGKGRNGKCRHAEHDDNRKNHESQFILHPQFPPFFCIHREATP
jgi:hypothetical protein